MLSDAYNQPPDNVADEDEDDNDKDVHLNPSSCSNKGTNGINRTIRSGNVKRGLTACFIAAVNLNIMITMRQ